MSTTTESQPASQPVDKQAALKNVSDGKKAERRLGLMLIAPAALLMIAVTGYPIIYAFWLSLQKYNLAFPEDREFVGISNYVTVLSDGYWWTAFGVTAGITIISVIIEFILGLAVALVMHRTIFGRGLVRTVVLIPYGIVTVAAAYSWYYAWTPGTGYLANLLPDGSAPLTEQFPSLAIVVLAEVWKTTPFMALLILAGLQMVPKDIYEAADIDGVHPVKQFFKITLPLVRPALMVAIIFRLLDALRIFDLIYVLTPNSAATKTMSVLARENLFDFDKFAYGSAMSTLLFLIIALLTILYIWLGKVRFDGGDR